MRRDDVLDRLHKRMLEEGIDCDVADKVVKDCRIEYGGKSVYIQNNKIRDTHIQVIRMWEKQFKYTDLPKKEVYRLIATFVLDVDAHGVKKIITRYEKGEECVYSHVEGITHVKEDNDAT